MGFGAREKEMQGPYKRQCISSPFLLPCCRSIERAMGEKKDQIRRLDEEINRDGERNKELEKRLQVGIFPRVMAGERDSEL